MPKSPECTARHPVFFVLIELFLEAIPVIFGVVTGRTSNLIRSYFTQYVYLNNNNFLTIPYCNSTKQGSSLVKKVTHGVNQSPSELMERRGLKLAKNSLLRIDVSRGPRPLETGLDVYVSRSVKVNPATAKTRVMQSASLRIDSKSDATAQIATVFCLSRARS